MVAPQNNNLAAAFPLAPLPKPQMVKGNDASRTWRSRTTGREECHNAFTHGKNDMLLPLNFCKGAAEFEKAEGYPHACRRLPYGAQKVSTKQRNKAFSGRKPFYGNTVSSAESSSVWERSVVVVENRVREDVGRRSEVRSVDRKGLIGRTMGPFSGHLINRKRKSEGENGGNGRRRQSNERSLLVICFLLH